MDAGRQHPETSRTAIAGAPGTDENEPKPARWLVFGIASCALLMASIDQTIVATALPSLQQALHARINWTGWTMTIYALGQITTMPLWGRASDQYGRKRIFLIATVVFTIASLCCALATNIYLLIVFRALQSIGGGAFLPSATGVVADQFGRERDRALGLFSSIFPIGGVIGPVLGGLAVTFWSWRGIFLVNVPISLILILLGVWFFPAGDAARGRARTDFRGALLLAVTILSGMYAVTLLGSRSRSSEAVSAAMLAGAAACAVLFLRRASRDPTSFVPMRLLHGRGFGVLNLINLLSGAAIFGFGGLVPLYAEERYGLSAIEASTLLSYRAVTMIGAAGVAVLILHRSGYRIPMICGFLMLAVGLVATWSEPLVGSPHLWLSASSALSGVGMGLSLPASNNAGLQLAPDDVAAVAGLRGMFRQSGGIASVSVITAVMAHSSDPSAVQAWGFLLLGLALACVTPWVRLVPNRRGGW